MFAPPLRLVHGWGFGAEVWNTLVSPLSERFAVATVSLPGYAPASAAETPETISDLAGALDAEDCTPAIWIGWSLGGMVALQLAATQPARVRALVLVATNASFIARPSWPYALPAAQLERIAKRLQQDVAATLKHFAKLAALGGARARETARTLLGMQGACTAPAPAVLAAGLRTLRDTDLCSTLAAVRCPLLLINGADDVLVPAAAAHAMAALNPRARVEIIACAGHAPFISHREEFLAAVARLPF